METAITELKIKLKMLENNEPIQREEGRTEDADRSAKGAAEVREAINVLKKHQNAATIPKRFLHRIFGIPVWTEDFNGEFRKRRGRMNPNGSIRTTAIGPHPILLHPNGSVSGRIYVRRWQYRPTLLG